MQGSQSEIALPVPPEEQTLRRRLEEGFVRAFVWLATSVYRLAGDWRGWRPLLTRGSAHLAVIVAAIVAIGLSSIEWPAEAAAVSPLPAGSAAGVTEATGEPLVGLDGQTDVPLVRVNAAFGGTVARLGQPHTIIPLRPRLAVITYTVQAGDTIHSIANRFHLDPTTLMWANPAVEDAPDLLRIGQDVIVLPVDGVYHRVVEGDTVESIAAKYKVDVAAIASCEYNELRGPRYTVREGMMIIAPGGEKPYVPKVVTSYTGSVPEGARGTGAFNWPVLGRITQGYWYGHRAIDIGAPTGSALLAADTGFVSFAGWTDVGYGYLTIIDHANGFATYYAHQSNIYVYEGQRVDRGQVIGAVGSTGWSTGPHLHFEVRYNGTQQNPRAYLP